MGRTAPSSVSRSTTQERHVTNTPWQLLQGVSKGGMVEAILTAAARTGTAPDFVLCIGDDRSDEDMFTAMEHVTFSPHLPAEVRCNSGGPLCDTWRCLRMCMRHLMCVTTVAFGDMSDALFDH